MNPEAQENIDDESNQNPETAETPEENAEKTRKNINEVLNNEDQVREAVKQEEARRKKAFNIVDKFIPQQTKDGLRDTVVSAVTKGVDDMRDKNGKELSDEKKDKVLDHFQNFLAKRVYETDKLIGVNDETASTIEAELRQDGKDVKLRSLQAQIKQTEQKIEDYDEEIAMLEKRWGGYKISNKGGGGDVQERRKEIEEQIDVIKNNKQSEKKKIRSLQSDVVATEQIAANLNKIRGKIMPETLMIHIHYYFLNAKKLQDNGGNSAKNDKTIKESEDDIYREAMDLANNDLNEYKMQQSHEDHDHEISGVKKIWLRTFIDFIAQSDILNDFPEDKKGKAEDVIKQLRTIDPSTEKGQIIIERVINHLATLLPSENREKTLQKIIAKTIATLEGSMDRRKWRAGISRKNIIKITQLTSGIRKAYEKRLATNEEGDFKDLMSKVEGFNRSVQEERQNIDPDLPDELRKYFNENSWLYRAARFMGAKGWAGAKIATPAMAKAGATTIKKHPWGTAKLGLAGLSIATGYIPAALTLWAGWKGGKKLFGWRIGKNKKTLPMPEIPGK